MESIVGKRGDMHDGEMKEVSVGDATLLLVRVDGRYHALNANCTHYGAPLVDGVLERDRIICPWHHACFHAATGDLIEPPALDALVSFPVHCSGDDIVVTIKEPVADRRIPIAARHTNGTDDVIAIVGGGAAGYMAAQTLRECGDGRRILVITADDRPPYDRPNVSKDYLHGHADPAWMPLRPDEFYEEYGIELMRGRTVMELDALSKTIRLDDGTTQAFDVALIASGGIPRKLDVPGASLANVFSLRSMIDADAIIAAAGVANRAVVVGSSFIAMEAAHSLTVRGIAVTVVAPDEVPFAKTLGPDIGSLFRSEHEKHGVTFRLGRTLDHINGTRSVEAVVLDNGERIDCDLVVAGIGVEPATRFIRNIELDERHGVPVDVTMCAADGVYAAGDVASFVDPRTGGRIRIEHWRTALQQGRVAAFNIAGRPTVYDAVPFFWTQQFELTLRYVGHATVWDEIIVKGDVAARDFAAYFVSNGAAVACATMNRDREAISFSELMRSRRMVSTDVLNILPAQTQA